MPDPLVSVIVPCYNREPYLREALDSALAQTFRDYEVILADDASTDRSAEIAKEYGDRVRLVALTRHVGLPGVVRNMALEQARGRYMAFLDSDDAWYPGKLERQVVFMESHPDLPLCHTYCHVVDASSRVLHVRHESMLPPTGPCFEQLLTHCFVSTSTVMVRADVFQAIGGYFSSDPFFRVGEDYECFLRVAQKYAFGLLPEVLGRYRRSDAGMTYGDWRYTPEAVPVHEWILDRPDRWQDRVPRGVVLRAFLAAALENARYWYDRGYYNRAAHFTVLALRRDAMNRAGWASLARVGLGMVRARVRGKPAPLSSETSDGR